jgi:GNAT superfamily N-acetyltransferase
MFTINIYYTQHLLRNKNNKMAFLCMDNNEFNIGNCPTGLIYTSEKINGEFVYYILMICTKPRFKNMGYASILMNGFIERIRKKHANTFRIENAEQSASPEGGVLNEKRCKIILSSIESAVTYYESYGFKWTRNNILDYPKLLQCETYEEDKEYFIMELVL